MKKILVISNMFPSKDHPTFGIFVKNQVDLLKASGLDIEVVANSNPDKGKVNLIKKYLFWFLRYLKYVALNHKKISVVHAHYIFPTGLLALMSKKVWNIPYAVTAHGGDLDQMPNKSNFVKKMTTLILKNANEVIVVGEALRENVLSLWPVEENRIHVISMGVDTEKFRKLDLAEFENLVPAEKSPVLLYVGNIIKAKGLVELVDAFKIIQSKYPNAALYLIGSRKDKTFFEQLERQIEQNQLSSIHFLNPLPQPDIVKWMNAADVLVLPSHIEGFGLVALEAMASGLPVVGSKVGGLEYLLADRRGLMFEKGDSKMLAEQLFAALRIGQDNVFDQEKIQASVRENSFENILLKLQRIYEGMEPSNE
ncbi:glycosyltransferase [Planococcus glaciei]|uniref:glycosyltransferase n=1 Tax=Planococcus glaciei TaxID=459472 RepID=UPI001C73426C|nr:glycosyltransferase [Planococcus glaciei]MBX0316849.1 glycosyltransferase [Planococcus glaciei]